MTIRPHILLITVSALILLTACATPKNHYDPFEPVNRVTFAFNDTLDRYAVKPVAKVYSNYVPGPAQQGVSNVFDNVSDVSSIVGNVMEGQLKNAVKDIGRVFINTVFGLFGLVDWASDLGLEKQGRSIGKALGYWGIGTGPYLVFPFFGPTTLRDSTDPIADWTVGIPTHFDTAASQYTYAVLGGVSKRAAFLPYENALNEQLIFDRYTYLRDSYLQKRYSEVYRGNPSQPLILGAPIDMNQDGSTENDSAVEPIAPDAVDNKDSPLSDLPLQPNKQP